MSDPYKLIGKKLGEHVLTRYMTSGGMAHIYLGEDKRLRRFAAVKILTPEIAAGDESLRERFEREARAAARLEHDNILPVYQVGEQDSLFYMAMRYIEGTDLAAELAKLQQKRQLMEMRRALYILEQVAAALDYAHAASIVHRDVKPSNILLGPDDKAYLSDFGLAWHRSDDTTMGTAFGTPRYISPEQARNSQQAVAQSDIYSLAVIVYEIVTGETMFKGKTPMEVALSHIHDQPIPPRAINPDIPADAQREILKALDKDPSKRHQTAMEFVNGLKQAYGLIVTPAVLSQQAVASTMPFLEDRVDATLLDAQPIPTPFEDEHTALADQDTAHQDEIAGIRRRRRKRGFRRLLLVALILAFIALGLTFRRDDIPELGERIAQFLDTSGAVQPPSRGGTPALLRYNDRLLVVKNVSTSDQDVSDLRFEGETGSFGTNDLLQRPLAPGACLVLKSTQFGPITVPSEWDCRGTREISFSRSSDLFWRADGTSPNRDEEFMALAEDRTLTQCPTAGMAVQRTNDLECSLLLPITR